MVSSQLIVDPDANYRVAEGYTRLEGDAQFLRANLDALLWAVGRRASDALRRLAIANGKEVLVLEPPSHWFEAISLPKEVIERNGKEIAHFFADALPTSESEARDCIRQWMSASRYANLGSLVEDANQLLAVLEADTMEHEARSLLSWLAKSRTGVKSASTVGHILEAANPIVFWLGLDQLNKELWISTCGAFLPHELPPKVVTLIQDHWRTVLGDGHFGAAAYVIKHEIPQSLSRCIRKVAKEVYNALNPNLRDLHREQCQTIFGPEWRPAKPAGARWTALPAIATTEACWDWFRAYRSELNWSEEMLPERIAAAQSFSAWFLNRERFPKWCAEGDAGPLSFSVSPMIRNAQHQHSVVLVVMVDGLGFEEHRKLVTEIGTSTSALYVHRDKPVFSLLPTITPVCKGGMLSGTPQREWGAEQPDYAQMVRRLARRDSRGHYVERWDTRRILRLLTDPDNSLVVVNHTELDAKLHASSNGEEANNRISEAITYLSGSVVGLVEQAKEELDSLAIMICSDHGQVVGPCRPLPAPCDVVKQRARYAIGSPQENEIELPAALSMCARDYFIINTDSAWTEGDQSVFGCHGGGFPEEVLVRVSLLSTRPNRPEIRISGKGEGVSGGDGTLEWSVKNTFGVEISVTRATLKFGSRGTRLEPPLETVPAFSTRICKATNVANWPSAEEARQAQLQVEYFVMGRNVPESAQGPVILESTLGYESTIFQL